MYLYRGQRSEEQKEIDTFWAGRESVAPYAPYTSPNTKLIAALRGLRPLEGINILDFGNIEIGSEKLIGLGVPRQKIEIAMLQLRSMSKLSNDTNKNDTSEKVIVWNNLGCAYALLDRYSDAEEALEEAVKLTTENEVKKVASQNLDIVSRIARGYL